MKVERAQLNVTLKCGNKKWKRGTIFDPEIDGRPIPQEIIAEARANPRRVTILGRPVNEVSLADVISAKIMQDKVDGLVAELEEVREQLAVANQKPLVADHTEVMQAEIDRLSSEEAPVKLTGASFLTMKHSEILDLLKDEKDFEALKLEKRNVLVGIARKRLVTDDQS